MSCDHTTYTIDRQPSLSAATLGFGAIKFEVARYPPEECNAVGYAPYHSVYYIWIWDITNITEYLR